MILLFGLFFDGGVSWNDPRQDEGSIVPTELIEERKLSGYSATESNESLVQHVGFASAAGFACRQQVTP